MKIFSVLFAMLSIFSAAPAFSEWVLLDRKQMVTTQDITFTNFVQEAYEDYMFVIDMMEPLGGFADVVMQFSNDAGNSWLSSYEGGITAIKSGLHNPVQVDDLPIYGKDADSSGIPITDVAHAGYFFIGKIHLANAVGIQNYGPLAIHGIGKFGSQEAHVTLTGSIGALNGVDSVRFVSNDIAHPTINRASVTLYGLKEWE